MPELATASEGDADVWVRWGTVPASIANPLRTGVLFEASPDEYLLQVPGVARYWVHAGSQVVVDANPGAEPRDVRAFLLGSTVTAVLHQRRRFVLHAGAVVGTNGAVLIAGASGSGKSTLLAALAARGYAVVADDLAAISVPAGTGAPTVSPSYPRLRLWRDALLRLGRDPAELFQVRASIDKYLVPLPEWDRADPVVAAVCVLQLTNDDRVRVLSIDDRDRFALLREHTRLVRVMEGVGMQSEHFAMAARFASAVTMRRVLRPRQAETIAEVLAGVEPLLQ